MNKQFAVIRKQANRAAGVVGTSVALGMSMIPSAHAVFTVPTEVTDAAVSVGLVGAAVFAIAVSVKLYKWIKGAL